MAQFSGSGDTQQSGWSQRRSVRRQL